MRRPAARRDWMTFAWTLALAVGLLWPARALSMFHGMPIDSACGADHRRAGHPGAGDGSTARFSRGPERGSS